MTLAIICANGVKMVLNKSLNNPRYLKIIEFDKSFTISKISLIRLKCSGVGVSKTRTQKELLSKNNVIFEECLGISLKIPRNFTKNNVLKYFDKISQFFPIPRMIFSQFD